jgi:hypothetical protein
MRWLIASESGLTSPLSFFAVAQISPCRSAPAPEYVPALRVACGVPAVLATWYATLGLGAK